MLRRPECILNLSYFSFSLKIKMISPDERIFIEEGIRQNIRNDGRQVDESRPVSVEHGIFKHTFGSARLTIGGTRKSEIIVACKGNLTDKSSVTP